MEPEDGRLDLDWLDRAIEVLGKRGLKVVLGTPTATPPRWMLTKHPDMLALDKEGRPRGFGSRRHYCFSHKGYRAELRAHRARSWPSATGATRMSRAWQTDNEYGCHDTVLSYSDGGAGRLPRLAGAALSKPAGAEPGLGQCVLVDGLCELRRDRPAEPDGDRAEPGPCHGLPPLRQRRGGRPSTASRPRSSGAFRLSHRPQLHGQRDRVRPFRGGRRPRYRKLGQLSAGLPVGPAGGFGRAQARRICGRATRTCRPSTTTFTAPWAGAAGGSWNSSRGR